MIDLKVFENPRSRPNHYDQGHKVDPKNIFSHENYDKNLSSDDIALIYIKEGLKQNFVDLPLNSTENLSGKSSIIGGFGYIDDQNNKKEYFEFVQLPITEIEECEKNYKNNFNEENKKKRICLKATEEMSTCK